MDSRRSSWRTSALGLLLFLTLPGLPLSRWENEFSGVGHLIGYEAIWWSMVTALLLYVLNVEHRPLASIGFRGPKAADIFIGIAAGLLAVAGVAVIYFWIFPALHWNESQPVNQLAATPLWWRLVSVVRAAVAEEMVFRGYAMERTLELSNSMAAACLLSWSVFTLEHVSTWGWSHVMVAGFGGAVLTAQYAWRRNLWSNILAHCLIDGILVLAS